MKKLIACLALGTVAISQPAMAQNLDLDLTEEEWTNLARYAMPGAFRGLQRGCGSQLPDDAYIHAQGSELLTRLEASALGTQDMAIDAFMKVAPTNDQGMKEVLGAMPPETLGPFLNEMVAGMVASQIKPDQCVTADRVLALLDPLPAENLAALVGVIVVEVQKGDAEQAPAEVQTEVE